MNKELDLSKPVQTRDGRAVRILCTDRKGTAWSVVGLVTYGDGTEICRDYSWDGFYSNRAHKELDLVNVPEPPRKRTLWMPVYDSLFSTCWRVARQNLYSDVNSALEDIAGDSEVLCIIPIEITDRWENDAD